MDLEGAVVLVTGTSRGLGQALVEALVDRNVRTIYACARNPGDAPASSSRVVPMQLDVTSSRDIADVASRACDVNILINNAGMCSISGPFAETSADLESQIAVNFVGPIELTRAFIPVLRRSRASAIVNILSLVSLASSPVMAGYSASKAAMHSYTQAIRSALSGQNIDVHGVYPAGIDTEMVARLAFPKTPPRLVAEGVVEGIAAGNLEIFPDPIAQDAAVVWSRNPKELERAFSSGVQ